jgi:hypothetical protein
LLRAIASRLTKYCALVAAEPLPLASTANERAGDAVVAPTP